MRKIIFINSNFIEDSVVLTNKCKHAILYHLDQLLFRIAEELPLEGLP